MDVSAFNLKDTTKIFFDKLSEITNMNNIDWSYLYQTLIFSIIIIFTSFFILWLLRAIGLYTIAKKNGDDEAFLAFIPFGCLYTMGKIVGKTKLFGIEISKCQYLLPLLIIVMYCPVTMWLSILLFTFFYYGVLYRIYQKLIPNAAIVLLILSIILPFLQPLFIFFIRNSKTSSSIKNKV